MSERQIDLPAGSHYAVLDAIPARFNGMTASTLQRSRGFVQRAGVEVTILTWEDRPDNDDVRSKLRTAGLLVDGMHIANLWDDARQWDDTCLSRCEFDRQLPQSFVALGGRGDQDGPLRRVLNRADGSRQQVDCLRPDGTVLASYLYADSGEQEALVLCNRAGHPLGAWSSITRMLQHWLDTLPRDPVAWLIFDSKVSAGMLADYERPDVVKMHVVRGSHLKRGRGPLRPLVTSRQSVMENLDAWDSVTFLTESQRSDVEARFGSRENLYVIPNSRNVPAELPQRRRPSGRGVMLASLDSRKRVAHAVRAMAAIKRRFRWRRIGLDVWGAGPLEAELNQLIESTRAPVKLRGYSRTAPEAFSVASFSLLTSRSEAFASVLIESMGRGCIPISYDMPYGPADIITHGVDGFLVPDGNAAKLADQIAWMVTARPSELAPIRLAAYRRALEFNDEQLVRRWSVLMSEIASRRGL